MLLQDVTIARSTVASRLSLRATKRRSSVPHSTGVRYKLAHESFGSGFATPVCVGIHFVVSSRRENHAVELVLVFSYLSKLTTKPALEKQGANLDSTAHQHGIRREGAGKPDAIAVDISRAHSEKQHNQVVVYGGSNRDNMPCHSRVGHLQRGCVGACATTNGCERILFAVLKKCFGQIMLFAEQREFARGTSREKRVRPHTLHMLKIPYRTAK